MKTLVPKSQKGCKTRGTKCTPPSRTKKEPGTGPQGGNFGKRRLESEPRRDLRGGKKPCQIPKTLGGNKKKRKKIGIKGDALPGGDNLLKKIKKVNPLRSRGGKKKFKDLAGFIERDHKHMGE